MRPSRYLLDELVVREDLELAARSSRIEQKVTAMPSNLVLCKLACEPIRFEEPRLSGPQLNVASVIKGTMRDVDDCPANDSRGVVYCTTVWETERPANRDTSASDLHDRREAM